MRPPTVVATVRDREAGFSVLLGMVAMVLTAIAVLLVFELVHHDLRELRLEERSSQLVALTDAALAESLARLAVDPGFTGIEPRTFGGGRVASTVQASDNGSRTVVAEAWFGGWRGRLSAEVATSTAGPRVVSWQRSSAPAGP